MAPLFFDESIAPGGELLVLSGAEGRHAAVVRRLRPGERVDVGDGAGLVAECVVVGLIRGGGLELEVRSRRRVPPPDPAITVIQAIPKGDRGELAVEEMTEVGVDRIVPWQAERSVPIWYDATSAPLGNGLPGAIPTGNVPASGGKTSGGRAGGGKASDGKAGGGRAGGGKASDGKVGGRRAGGGRAGGGRAGGGRAGDGPVGNGPVGNGPVGNGPASRGPARWRSTAREAAKQSLRAWIPEVTAVASTQDAARIAAASTLAVLLDPGAPLPLAGLQVPSSGDLVIVIGPEGGITDQEHTAFLAAGATARRLGPTVLRTSTAAAVTAAVLLSRTPRWA